jgi:hypothetical protein
MTAPPAGACGPLDVWEGIPLHASNGTALVYESSDWNGPSALRPIKGLPFVTLSPPPPDGGEAGTDACSAAPAIGGADDYAVVTQCGVGEFASVVVKRIGGTRLTAVKRVVEPSETALPVYFLDNEGPPAIPAYNKMWLFDEQEKVACDARLAGDGVMRCLPNAEYESYYFADSSCTTPVGFRTQSGTPPVGALAGRWTSKGYALHPVGGVIATPSPLYWSDQGGCIAAPAPPSGGSYVSMLAEIDPTRWIAVTLVP